MSNKRFLKRLLATTAVFGTLAAGAMEAQAAAQATGGAVVGLDTAPLGPNAVAWQLGGASTNSGNWIFINATAGGVNFNVDSAIVPGIIVGAVPTTASTFSTSFSVGPIIQTAGAANRMTLSATVTGKTVTLNGISTAINAAAFNAAATTALGAPLTMQNAYSGLAVFDAQSKGGIRLRIDTTAAGFTPSTAAAPLVFSNTQFKDTGGVAGVGDSRIVVVDGTYIRFESAAGGAGAEIFGPAGDLMTAIDVGNGGVEIKATGGKAIARTPTINFTSPTAGQAILTADGVALTAGNITTSTEGVGKVIIQGTNAATVGTVGAARRIASVQDLRSGAAVVSSYGAIRTTGDVTIDHISAASAALTFAGIDSSTGAIKVYNNTGNIDLTNNLVIAGTSVDLKIVGAAGNFVNGGAVTANNGNITITTSGNGLQQALGALTAIKGNTILTAGNALGIKTGVIKTKQLTLDTAGHNLAGAFSIGGDGTALSNGLNLANTDANIGLAVTVLDGASSYIGDITVASNKNTVTFNNALGNKVYVGNVAAGSALATLTVGDAGQVIVVDGSTVNATTINYTATGTLVLGNNVTVNASTKIDGAGAVANIGNILLTSTNVGAANNVTGVMTPGNTNPVAKVVATINTNSVGQAKTLSTIDFGTTGDGSKLIINGVSGTPILINVDQIKFSTTAGSKGTLALTGGSDHTLTLTNAAGSVTTPAGGSITSDTTGTLTVNANAGSIGAVGVAGNRAQNALASITADNATNIILTTINGGSAYVGAINMGAGKTLTLGVSAGANSYMIGAINTNNATGANIAFTSGATGVTLSEGTNLGNFGTLTLGANTGGGGAPFVLTVNDGVNLTGTRIVPIANNTGAIKFVGSSNNAANANIATIGTPDLAVNKVSVESAAGTATVSLGTTYSTTGVTLGVNNNVLKVTGSILGVTQPTPASITSLGTNNAVVFANSAGANNAITLAGDIVYDVLINTPQSISVGAGIVNVQNAKAINSKAITGTADGGALNFTGMGNNVTGLDTMNITGPNSGKLTISIDGTMTRAAISSVIGTQNNNAALTFNAAAPTSKFIIGTSAYANFTTSVNNNGIMVVNGKGVDGAVVVGNIGTKDAMFNIATINAGAPAGVGVAPYGAVTVGDLYATTSNVGYASGGGVYNIGNTGGTLNLIAATQAAKVATSDTINIVPGSSLGDVRTAQAGLGIIQMRSGTISGQVGAQGALISALNLNGVQGDVVQLNNANVYAPVTHNSSTLNLLQNSTLQGAYNATGATITVNDYQLNTAGLATLRGTNTINGNLNYSSVNGAAGGSLVFNALDINDPNTVIKGKLVFNVDTSVELPTSNSAWNVVTITNPGNVTPAQLLSALQGAAVTNNQFLKLTPFAKMVNGTLVGGFTSDRNVGQLITNIKKVTSDPYVIATTQMFVDQQDIIAPGSQASFVQTAFSNMTNDKQAETAKRWIASNQKPSVAVETAVNMSTAINTRMNTLPELRMAAGEGASAGDEASAIGAWASAFGAQDLQGSRKGNSGYKSKTFGGVVGFDIALNDQLIVGCAGGVANTNTKFTDINDGNKVKSNVYVFSVYSAYDLGNSWVMQGSAMFGNGSVKSTSLRSVGNTNYETASGKYDTVVGGAEVLGGYKFQVSDASTIAPLAGVSYVRSSENAYKETGTTNQNFDFSDRTKEKLEGIVGLRAGTSVDMDGTIISPEVYGSVNYDFIAKAPKVNMSLSGLAGNIQTKTAKPARLSYDIGAGVMAKADMVEFGINYATKIGDRKFQQQGTLKVRVNL